MTDAADGLPFSQACENNKAVIADALVSWFGQARSVLEIGSGSGQHACHFAAQMPWLQWQPTEMAQGLALLRPRIQRYSGANLLPPLALDVCDEPWAVPATDALFTANTLHIMPFDAVQCLFQRLAEQAGAPLLLAVYGPFNYGGRYTSPSNAEFDQWLAMRDPHSAIRDFEAVDALAQQAGYTLREDRAMPANNRLLLWQRPARA